MGPEFRDDVFLLFLREHIPSDCRRSESVELIRDSKKAAVCYEEKLSVFFVKVNYEPSCLYIQCIEYVYNIR
jgi:hypothetical protein